MAESKKPSPAKHVNDVARPGQSAPSASSRPVIVSNRPILKDPMMVSEDDAEEAKTAETLASKAKDIPKLQMPAATIAPPTSEADVETSEATTDETPTKKAPDESLPDDTAPAEPNKDKASSSTVQNPDNDVEAKQQAEHTVAIQKLIATRQYFLPINAVEKRRSKRFVALGIMLSLILAVAWVDVALDASLIHLGGIKSITHFFSN